MMKPVNFEKLMAKEPYMYDEIINTQGLRVQFYEHPVWGDEFPVLVVFPAEKLAFCSEFFDTDDMMANGDYEPQLMDDQHGGVCMCRFEVNL